MIMKKALVTGSSGLIGSKCVERLHELGFSVVGIDNDMRSYFFGSESSTSVMTKNLVNRFKNYTHVNADIRDLSKMRDVFKNDGPFEIIIHTAAQPSHDWAAKEPLTDFTVNALATVQLLELYRELSPEASFIFTSTNKVYGDSPNGLPVVELETRYELFNEDGSLASIDESMSIDSSKHSIFGASKVSADVMVQEYGRYWGLNTVSFRGGCLTGPSHQGAELHGFLSYLVKRIVDNETYTIFGYKGKQVRDNIHSDDLVSMFLEYHKNPKSGAVYNAGGGRNNAVSIIEAVDKINHLIFEMTGRKFWGEGKLNLVDKNREGDHIWYISDLSKFHRDYPNWSQQYTIEKTLEEMVSNRIRRS